eukprot:TRINITY_DN63549_c0_g1_i1.p1 TRINITY_DN63549_c0_g1~~TRINITY_DN63549_c0_g1_i1.p1  ORF type:complete len:411 (-),score=58.83 TRINITY_DN63549_c0_g1_i1:109-1290(-)
MSDSSSSSCTSSASGVQQKEGQATKATAQALLSELILDKLFATLQVCPLDERRTHLSKLPESVKEALLQRFGKISSARSAEIVAQNQDTSSSESGSDGDDDQHDHSDDYDEDNESRCFFKPMPLEDVKMEPLPRQVGTSQVSGDDGHGSSFPCAGPGKGRGVTSLRGIFKYGNGLRYWTLVGIGRFRVRSHSFGQLEDAIECHIALLSAKRAVLELCRHSNDEFQIHVRAAFKPLSSKYGLRFATHICAKRLIGRSLYSPENQDLDAALKTCSKLRQANAQGWDALRKTWMEIQMAEGPNKGRGAKNRQSVDSLELLVRSWEKDDSNRRVLWEKRQIQRRAQRIQSLVQKYLNTIRIWNLAVQRKQKKLRQERVRWSRRSDLTMEDILRGPPM